MQRLIPFVLAGLLVSVGFAGDARNLTATRYLKHVQYLADDDRAGRKPGTEGIEAAAAYIAGQFEAAGLKPAGVAESWFQSFPVASIKQLKEADAVVRSTPPAGSWKLHEDFVPFPFTATGEVSGPLAFAGYGIEAAEYQYDDYADFDATGKVLLIFRHEPKSEDSEASFGGASPSAHALFVRKARTAARHGAVGLLVVNPPNRYPDGDELYPWSAGEARSSYALPMVHITQQAADALLKQAHMPGVAVLQAELDEGRESLSTDLAGVQVTINPGVAPVATRNVIGLLPGTDKADEFVVVGAHYDHVGTQRSRRGGGGPQVHNGADDNASGTAGVIELAHQIAAGPRPRRSMIFMAFSAEESGLLGSEWFCDHPTVPIDKIRAMINFDMIGRLSQDKLTIFGIATGAEFQEMVTAAAEPLDLKYEAPLSTGGIFTRSDHYNFFRKGVPVLFPFTGLHENYHRPGDDWELIDAEGATRLLRFAHGLLLEMANLEDGPTYVDPDARDEPADERDRVHAPPGDADAPRVEVPRLTVRLGVAPDMTGKGDGMLINTVYPGSAAEKAGMKKGDRIIRIASTEIVTPRDYMAAVAGFSPGDETEITVQRGDQQEVVLKVRFDAPTEE